MIFLEELLSTVDAESFFGLFFFASDSLMFCFAHICSIIIIDHVLKHPVDSSFLVRSMVLLAMKYPDIIETKCPMIYLRLHDNSVPFIAAVFDELEVKSIYQDSLWSIHRSSSVLFFHSFLCSDLCCVATAFLLCKWCVHLGVDVIPLVLQCKKKQCTDSEYLDNMLDINAFWRKYHIIRGVERYKVEQSHHLPVCLSSRIILCDQRITCKNILKSQFSFFMEAAATFKKMICEYKKNHPAHV